MHNKDDSAVNLWTAPTKSEMPAGRRPSWSASSQRRSSLSKVQVGGSTTHNSAGVDNIVDVSQFTKQLNTRTHVLSSHPTRDVSSTIDLGRVGDGDELVLGDDDDDDDDLRLDNILSCIVNDTKVDQATPVLGIVVGRPESMTSKHSSVAKAPSISVDNNKHVVKGGHNNRIQNSKIRHTIPFALENDIVHRIETPPIINTYHSVDEVNSPVSDEGGDKFLGVRDITVNNRFIASNDHGAEFSRSMSKSNIGLEYKPTAISQTGADTGCSGDGTMVGNSLVDSILDDIDLSKNRTSDGCLSSQEQDQLSPLLQHEVTPPRGQFSTHNNTRAPPPNPASQAKVLGGSKQSIVDDEASALTEPTDSPFIYTYKRSIDDDSVSQITSSLVGSSHMNLLFRSASRSTNMQINRPGLSWLNNDSTVLGGGSRMIHRKGLYGRERIRKSNKKSTFSSGMGAWSNESRGKNNIDEIAYALNADHTTGMSQRGKSTMPPLRNERSGLSPRGGEEKSAVSRHGFVDEVKSNVSRLGMGGVSCGGQSVSEATADTETTASTLGFFKNLALITWKAQHRVGLYFFPIPAAVTRRKKFDRSDSLDSLEELLLEEGATTLPRRKHLGVRSGHCDDDDEDDEIDYFSRAMSASSNSGVLGSRMSKRNALFGKNRAAAFGCVSVLLTIAFTIYRMPVKEKFGLKVTHQAGQGSSLKKYKNVHASDAADAMDVDVERQADITVGNRLRRIQNNATAGANVAGSDTKVIVP